MDALSDVLKSIHLEGAVYLNIEFTAPWCVQSRFALACIRDRLAVADHVMFFHFLLEGRCKVRLDGSKETVEACAGDLVLFPEDRPHLLGSDLRLEPIEAGSIPGAGATDVDFVHLRYGGGGEATRFVCGYIACNRSVGRPMIEGLPDLVHIPVGNGPLVAPMRELLQMGVRESLESRPGGASMLAKLSELLFVEAMRRYVETLPPGGSGWLSGVRDPQIGKALALLHGDPSRAWSVESLAREVALSRSALAERFTTLLGEPPMKYLMRWRLALAAQMLRETRETVIRIAERSGYESEAAFNRAFKREFGSPPASWRRAAR